MDEMNIALKADMIGAAYNSSTSTRPLRCKHVETTYTVGETKDSDKNSIKPVFKSNHKVE